MDERHAREGGSEEAEGGGGGGGQQHPKCGPGRAGARQSAPQGDIPAIKKTGNTMRALFQGC